MTDTDTVPPWLIDFCQKWVAVTTTRHCIGYEYNRALIIITTFKPVLSESQAIRNPFEETFLVWEEGFRKMDKASSEYPNVLSALHECMEKDLGRRA